MLRRTAFKKPQYEPPPVAPLCALLRPVNVARIESKATTCPKENMLRSSTYEARVRKLPCMRCGIVGFTQFCHTDQGKGQSIKTDVRRGWAGCAPHGDSMGCHYFIGTSGTLPREEKRRQEEELAAKTRAEILCRGWWPAKLPLWEA